MNGLRVVFWYMLFSVALLDSAGSGCLTKKELEKVLDNPHVRAFLDTISYSEGTYEGRGYRKIFSGDYFDSYAQHPRQYRIVRNLKSTAAGRYQLLGSTWDYVAKKLGLVDFSPRSQDQAAVQLVFERRALGELMRGNFGAAVQRTAGTWASFPYARYGQRMNTYQELKKFYDKRLAYYVHGERRVSGKRRAES